MYSSTKPKAYWSLLKTFLINKKTCCIPPLFHNNKVTSNFRGKDELFNNVFAQQCTLISNASKIPSTFNIANITRANIAKMIKNTDQNKAHAHDMISVEILKLCDNSILPPLELIFKSCLESGGLPSKWKKANVVPVHKKGDKQSIKNYCPTMFLLTCGKIFEIQQYLYITNCLSTSLKTI